MFGGRETVRTMSRMSGVLSLLRRAPSNHELLRLSTSSSTKGASTCWNCGMHIDNCILFCPKDSCGVVQPVQSSALDFFALFGVPRKFRIDDKELENSFKQLQKRLHPDRHATSSKMAQEASVAASTAVNIAYQVCFWNKYQINHSLSLISVCPSRPWSLHSIVQSIW